MRKCFIFVFLCSSISCKNAVSSNSTSSPFACSDSLLLGNYTGTLLGASDTLTFSSDCSLKSSYCNSQGSFSNISTTSGNIRFVIATSNGTIGCLATGTSTCSYSLNASTFVYNCGSTNFTYTKSF